MKTKQRQSFILLALFHLLIFSYPLAVKAVHSHTDCYTFNVSETVTVGHEQDPCLICSFEFVSFIVEHSQLYAVFLPAIPVANSAAPTGKYAKHLFTVSLRGPPAS